MFSMQPSPRVDAYNGGVPHTQHAYAQQQQQHHAMHHFEPGHQQHQQQHTWAKQQQWQQQQHRHLQQLEEEEQQRIAEARRRELRIQKQRDDAALRHRIEKAALHQQQVRHQELIDEQTHRAWKGITFKGAMAGARGWSVSLWLRDMCGHAGLQR